MLGNFFLKINWVCQNCPAQIHLWLSSSLSPRYHHESSFGRPLLMFVREVSLRRNRDHCIKNYILIIHILNVFFSLLAWVWQVSYWLYSTQFSSVPDHNHIFRNSKSLSTICSVLARPKRQGTAPCHFSMHPVVFLQSSFVIPFIVFIKIWDKKNQ